VICLVKVRYGKRYYTRLKSLDEKIFFSLVYGFKHRNHLLKNDLLLFYTLLYFFKAEPSNILALNREDFKVGTVYFYVQLKGAWQRVVLNSNIEPICNSGLDFPFLLLNRLVEPARCIQRVSKELYLLIGA